MILRAWSLHDASTPRWHILPHPGNNTGKFWTYMLMFHSWLNPMNMRTNRTKKLWHTKIQKQKKKHMDIPEYPTWTSWEIWLYLYLVSIPHPMEQALGFRAAGFGGVLDASRPIGSVYGTPRALTVYGVRTASTPGGSRFRVGRVSPGWGWEMVTTRWGLKILPLGSKKKPTCLRGVYGKYPGFHVYFSWFLGIWGGSW